MHHYIFGYELPDTTILLTESGKCLILATKKKCEFLEPAVGNAPTESTIKKLTLLTRNKSDENKENFETLMEEAGMVKNDETDSKKRVGVFLKEWSGGINTGPILSSW